MCGDGGIGWSKAWKICFWARLLDGNHAHKLLGEREENFRFFPADSSSLAKGAVTCRFRNSNGGLDPPATVPNPLNRMFRFFLAAALMLPLAFLRANEPGGFTPLVTTPVTSGTVTYRSKTCRYLDNGIIRAIVSPTGNVQSIRYLKPGLAGTPAANGVEMVSQSASSSDGGFGNHTEIYYYWYPDGTAGTAYQATTGNADRLQLVYDRPYTASIHKLPMDVKLHYTLGRGETTLYIHAALDHQASYAQADLQFIQMIWPIAHNATDFLCENLYIDDTVKLGLSLNGTQLRRNSLEPTYGDIKKAVWVTGLPGEINQLTSGPFNGQLTGKYSYNIPHNIYKTWGRASDINDVGKWVVAGSQEYGNNGPTRREYVHGWGLMYHQPISNHYSNRGISIPAGQAWTKIIGPWGLYFNGLPTGAQAWADAKAQGDAEAAAWPYAWVTHPAYQPQAQRATLSGQLVLSDPLRPGVSAAGAWVGLAAPDSGENSADNWQFQADRHQYWVRADASGNFTIPDIQTTSTFGGTETYQLYVYSAGETPGTGAVGEFRLGHQTFTPGENKNLGSIPLTVDHPGGSLVWEIGIPDRSAAEFRHGDEYAKPALWLQYGSEYSNPHQYDVAAGNWATNFNFSHTVDYVGTAPWKWNLNFPLTEVIPGTYWLTIAYASADSIQILRVNDNSAFATFTPPNARPGASSFMRQSVQTKYTYVRVPIPASRLRVGANTISLDHEVHTNHTTAGFMYDYLSLEAPDPPVLPPGRDLQWKGGVSSNAWNASAANWLVSGTSTPALAFVDGDRPIFSDAGSNSPAITLSGTLQPGRMTFTHSTAMAFTLGGTGTLAGPFELRKPGNGTLTITPFQQTVTASFTAGSPVVTVASTSGLSAGLAYASSSAAHDFPHGTRILSVDSPTSITLSAGAVSTRSNITLNFGSAHTYFGGTTIDAGTVVLGNATANSHGLGTGLVTLNGGTITMWNNLSANHRSFWDLVVPIGSTARLNAGSRVDLCGSLSGGGDLTFHTPYIRASVMGNWSGFSGNLSIVTDGDGGDWRVGNNLGLPLAAVELGPLVNAYCVLTGNQTIPLGDLRGNATSILKATETGASTALITWRIGSRNTDASMFPGSIRDSSTVARSAIEKTGDGIWTLSGANTYTGPTRVAAGTLRVNGSTSGSAFTVSADAALGGSGSLTGNVSIEDDGVLELSATPLAITGDVILPTTMVVRASADPGPGTHLIATFTGAASGSPTVVLDAPVSANYAASLTTANGRLELVLSVEDADQDLIKDAWELTHYPSITTAGPLDDTDGDGYNAYTEFLAGSSPVDPASFPEALSHAVATSDGTGFDGTLYEVDGSGLYSGNLVINDSNKRNLVRQDPAGPRHFLTVFKFDLTSIPARPVMEAALKLTVNSSTVGTRTRTLSVHLGDDALVTPSIRYNAANPFIDDSYLPEILTDTDFAPGAVSSLVTFSNSTAGGSVDSIGSGQTGLRAALSEALATDRFIILILHGGSTQYLTQADEDTTAANRPTLQFTTGGDPAPDLDVDGMADAWEAAHFSSLSRDGAADLDGDGSADLTEFRLGLDPENPGQSFRANGSSSGAGFQLSWPSRSGLQFQIRRSGSPSGPWAVVGTQVAGSGTSSTFTDAAPPSGRAFYQIALQP